MTSTYLSSCLLAVVLVGCAESSSSEGASSSNDALTSTKVTPVHVACTTAVPGQWPLELLTQASGAVDALYGGGSVTLGGTMKDGNASLGQFLSGAYTVKLDAALLAGKAGTATLTDDESDGSSTPYPYACAPVAATAAKLTCTPKDASQWPLTLTTSANGKLVADYAGGAISWDSTLAGGDAQLGQFLSGIYAVHLDADLLDGRAGTATLLDTESDANAPAAIAYDCKP